MKKKDLVSHPLNKQITLGQVLSVSLCIMLAFVILSCTNALSSLIVFAFCCLPFFIVAINIQLWSKFFKDIDHVDWNDNGRNFSISHVTENFQLAKNHSAMFSCLLNKNMTRPVWLMSIFMILGFVLTGVLWH